MKKYVTLVIALSLKFSYSQNYSDLTKELDSTLPIELKKSGIPGMAIAIIEKDSIVYEKGIGHADKAKGIKVTSNTGFNIGSISKLFTAWGIMKLVEQHKIDLDVPVENYLRRWKLPKSEFDHKKVTVRALLSHTAGISVHGYPGFHPDETLPSLEASLNGVNGSVRPDEKVEVIIEPQTKFKYSGGGY